VIGRFSIPYLVRLIRRRFVFTLGTLSLAISSMLLAFDEVPALAVALTLSTFAFACIEITSQLYLLDHVTRHSLKHFEPIRIFASAGSMDARTVVRHLPPTHSIIRGTVRGRWDGGGPLAHSVLVAAAW